MEHSSMSCASLQGASILHFNWDTPSCTLFDLPVLSTGLAVSFFTRCTHYSLPVLDGVGESKLPCMLYLCWRMSICCAVHQHEVSLGACGVWCCWDATPRSRCADQILSCHTHKQILIIFSCIDLTERIPYIHLYVSSGMLCVCTGVVEEYHRRASVVCGEWPPTRLISVSSHSTYCWCHCSI